MIKTHHPSKSQQPQLQKHLYFLQLQLLALPPQIPYPIEIMIQFQRLLVHTENCIKTSRKLQYQITNFNQDHKMFTQPGSSIIYEVYKISNTQLNPQKYLDSQICKISNSQWGLENLMPNENAEMYSSFTKVSTVRKPKL